LGRLMDKRVDFEPVKPADRGRYAKLPPVLS